MYSSKLHTCDFQVFCTAQSVYTWPLAETQYSSNKVLCTTSEAGVLTSLYLFSMWKCARNPYSILCSIDLKVNNTYWSSIQTNLCRIIYTCWNSAMLFVTFGALFLLKWCDSFSFSKAAQRQITRSIWFHELVLQLCDEKIYICLRGQNIIVWNLSGGT